MLPIELPILPSNLCKYCEHYSFKIFYGSPTPEDYTKGKCFGWTDEGVTRWTDSEKTCEHFQLDYAMAKERATWVTPERFKTPLAAD